MMLGEIRILSLLRKGVLHQSKPQANKQHPHSLSPKELKACAQRFWVYSTYLAQTEPRLYVASKASLSAVVFLLTINKLGGYHINARAQSVSLTPLFAFMCAFQVYQDLYPDS